VATGFAIMGFIGYFVKLIHIPMYVVDTFSSLRRFTNLPTFREPTATTSLCTSCSPIIRLLCQSADFFSSGGA
jgi:hypothetical protein